MTISKNDTVVKHFGIPGMHWGIRRARGSSGSRSSTGRRVSTRSPDHELMRSLRKKKVHELSNDEIRALAARVDLERKYKEITMTRGQKVRRAVGKMLTEAAKKHLVKALGSDEVAQMGKALLTQAAASAKNKK